MYVSVMVSENIKNKKKTRTVFRVMSSASLQNLFVFAFTHMLTPNKTEEHRGIERRGAREVRGAGGGGSDLEGRLCCFSQYLGT